MTARPTIPAGDIDVAYWLKQDSPPTKPELSELRSRAGNAKWRVIPKGTIILREGEQSEECYLLCRGQVEVLLATEEGAERGIATLQAGTLIGEAAALTSGVRDATVRALRDCELLTIGRPELLKAMREDRETAIRVLDLLRLRMRPRCAPNIAVHDLVDAKGQKLTILRDREGGRYYRLSHIGLFLWQRLDGSRTLSDLVLDCASTLKVLAPQAVMETIDGLERAGFAEIAAPRADVQAIAARHTPFWSRLGKRIESLLQWEVVWNGADAMLTSLYRGGLSHLFSRTAQIVLATVAIVGFLAFLDSLPTVWEAMMSVTDLHMVLALLPVFAFALLVHELGHGLTAKSFGREVPRMGAGWNWCMPVVFVDTSDMWLADRWPRVAVNLAGIYANAVLGGIAAIVAWLIGPSNVSEVLWLFAVMCYALFVTNINPWLEHDGHFVLSDLLDRPHLREESFAWIRRDFLTALKTGKGLRGHWVDLLYGLGAFVYVVLFAALVVFVAIRFVYPEIALELPKEAAAIVTGLLAALFIGPAAWGGVGSAILRPAAESASLRNIQLSA